MMPCSFDNQEMRWAVNLRKHTIEEAWNGEKFEDFRNYLRAACPDCENQRACMGGCPIRPEIVLCKKKVLYYQVAEKLSRKGRTDIAHIIVWAESNLRF